MLAQFPVGNAVAVPLDRPQRRETLRLRIGSAKPPVLPVRPA